MIIEWIQLLVGLLFGLVPGRLLLNCECRYLAFDEMWHRVLRRPTDDGRRRRWWKLPLVWIDPVRGYVVGWMLAQAFVPPPDAKGIFGMLPAALATGAVLLGAIWMQTMGRQDERESISPTTFLAGLMVALLPWEVSVPTLIMGLASAIAMQGFAAGYLVAFGTLGLVGVLMMGKSLTLATALGLMIAPLVINWLRGTRLVMPVRC